MGILLMIIAMFYVAFISKRDELFKESKLIERFKKQKWFQNPWLVGVGLFMINALLFGITGILFWSVIGVSEVLIILLMVLPVVISLLIWIFIRNAWQGEGNNRSKMGWTGSSFYLFVALFAAYKWLNVKPLYPGDDTFMAALGFMFIFIVAVVAFATCFCLVSFPKKGHN